MPYYEKYENPDLVYDRGEVVAFKFHVWIRRRILELNELHALMEACNLGDHPWIGRLQRVYGKSLARLQMEWPQELPELYVAPVEIEMDWLEEQKAKIFGVCGRAQKFSTMCREANRWNMMDKDTIHLANVVVKTFGDELAVYDAVIDKKWVPPIEIVQPQIAAVELICMVLRTARATENEDLVIRKATRNSYIGLQREYYNANEAHGLGWEVQDWKTPKWVPMADGSVWVDGIYHDENHGIMPWPQGFEPVSFWIGVMTTAFRPLMVDRKQALETIMEGIHRKHWGHFRGLVQRELAIVGNSNKGTGALSLPVMSKEEVESFVEKQQILRPHWSGVRPADKDGWSLNCTKDDEVDHESCRMGGCRCSCHNPYISPNLFPIEADEDNPFNADDDYIMEDD